MPGVLVALFAATACGSSPTSPGGLATSLSFSVSPIDTSVIEFITPLGNLNPPDHTFPTDHIYFYHHLNHQTAPAYVVVAPAAGTVTSIVQHGDQKVNVQVTSSQTYYLDHVVLDGTIQQNTKVTAGQRLGVTSSGAYGLDLGLVSQNVTLGFINPARYSGDSVHAGAPLKYFAEPLKSTLYGLVSRVGADKDGQVCFDQAGTLAGNWFLESLPVSQSAVFTSGPMELAFVRDVTDPSQFRISIGGTLAMTGVLNVAAGAPDPASVTPATGAVAYAVTPGAFGAPSGVILVQMTAASSIRIEAFPGGTSGAVSFTSNTRTYVR
jgi:hypothetical protein